jgi:hypothetical protein
MDKCSIKFRGRAADERCEGLKTAHGGADVNYLPARPIGRMTLTSLVGLIAAACLALAPGKAHAGLLVASAPDCSNHATSNPFMPWLDPADYFLAPGGDFEGAAPGWQLNSTAFTAGNEPYYVGSTSDAGSLRLPNGSSATTPTLCVGVEHPTIRFFARNSGSILASLRVDVMFEDALGGVHTVPVGVVDGLGGWKVTAPMVVAVNLLPLLPGEHTPVRFTVTPQGGDWRIDDFYVDPRRSG